MTGFLAALLVAPYASAQGALPVLQPGNAVVTGYSGLLPPNEIPPGVDPGEQTTIDVNGPSARVVDLSSIAGTPPAPFVPAPKPFTVTAAQVGQVFGVALDNAVPPNVYLAASASYGVPLATIGANGAATHVRVGGVGVRFMPGLWGPDAVGGGPKSIWKVDGRTGVVTLFATVGSSPAGQSAAALGGLAFSPNTNSLYVADRSSGLIHRFDSAGQDQGSYDHGGVGLPAVGLPAVPLDGTAPPDISTPAFNSEDPSTWGFAAADRRVFGVAIHDGRLFYAVAGGLQIWSVGLGPDGAFASDARLEVSLPPADAEVEISKITFDHDGRMLLAERPAPTGAFDMEVLATEGSGRVLRYALVTTAPGLPPTWQEVPDEYAVGLPLTLRNANGGLALGWRYDAAGHVEPGTCGQYVWATGEQLRRPADTALAATLALTGPLDVDGLQGDTLDAVRPANAPPLASPYIDYDDLFDDPAARGHMGDIAIAAPCAPAYRTGAGWLPWGFGAFGWMPPAWFDGFYAFLEGGGGEPPPPPPPPMCPVDQQKTGFQCCPSGTFRNDAGQCAPVCPNGAKDSASLYACLQGYDPATINGGDPAKYRCLDGSLPTSQGCIAKSSALTTQECPAGAEHKTLPGGTTICLATPAAAACKGGDQFSPIDGQCHKLCPSGGVAYAVPQCCPPGSSVSGTGQCCPPGTVSDAKGACSPPPQPCPSGQTTGQDGSCTPIPACLPPNIKSHGKCCSPDDLKPGGSCAQVCPAGRVPVQSGGVCCDGDKAYDDSQGARRCCPHNLFDGKCVRTPEPGCVGDYTKASTDEPVKNSAGAVIGSATEQICCRAAQVNAAGFCCPAGTSPGGPNRGQCVPNRHTPPGGGGSEACPRPRLSDGSCPPEEPPTCPRGYKQMTNGNCCPADRLSADGQFCRPRREGSTCPAGTRWDGRRCAPDTTSGQQFECPTGSTFDGRTCVPAPVAAPPPPGIVSPPVAPPVILPLVPPNTFRRGPPPCPAGTEPQGNGCVPVPPPQPQPIPPPGSHGAGPAASTPVCAPGTVPFRGRCLPVSQNSRGCAPGLVRTQRGCVAPPKPASPPPVPSGNAPPPAPQSHGCAPGTVGRRGRCIPVRQAPVQCPGGSIATSRGCRPIAPPVSTNRSRVPPFRTPSTDGEMPVRPPFRTAPPSFRAPPFIGPRPGFGGPPPSIRLPATQGRNPLFPPRRLPPTGRDERSRPPREPFPF